MNDFRLGVSALRRHLAQFTKARDQLKAMAGSGATIDVALRRPSGAFANGALATADVAYNGFPNSIINIRPSEKLDNTLGANATWNTGTFGVNAFAPAPGVAVSFETVLLHEVGHAVGAFENGGWTWSGVGFDGVVGAKNSPNNPVFQEAVRWGSDATKTYGMAPLPSNSVHSNY
jgi:hypothetical protein